VLESAQVITEKANKVKLELASLRAVDQSDGKEMGRVDDELMDGRVYEGSILTIGEKNYKVQSIDKHSKTLCLKFTAEIDGAMKVDLETGLVVQKNRKHPFRIGSDKVRIKEIVEGYTSYDSFDIENHESKRIEPAPPERDFTTRALYISFPDKGVSEAILHSLVHLLRALMPTVVACEGDEIELTYDTNHPDLNESSIFVYDNCIDALGIVDSIRTHYEALLINKLLGGGYQLLIDCPCREGCPSCLHIFQCRSLEPNSNLNKKDTIEFLGQLLDKKDYRDIIKYRYDKVDKGYSGYGEKSSIWNSKIQLPWLSVRNRWKD
jgi:DEAD/DEAH box helicase domain-containing protein